MSKMTWHSIKLARNVSEMDNKHRHFNEIDHFGNIDEIVLRMKAIYKSIWGHRVFS